MTQTLRSAALMGAVVALLLAPAAAADPTTAGGNAGGFLDELGWTNATLPGKTPGEMVAAGYETCQQLRGGVTVLDEMTAVERKYQFSQGTIFVSAATTNLCPDFAS